MTILNAFQLIDEGTTGDITACPTPDWDKQSSSNVSEISVACLQDKINQMQETHYRFCTIKLICFPIIYLPNSSTHEELQATLQELTDLQRQLSDAHQDNERLQEEKNLMFDSLCRQTERLNECRTEVESLKQRLYRNNDEIEQYESVVEREQKLMELLKTTQEEREILIFKQEQINKDLIESDSTIHEQNIVTEQMKERIRTLESTLDAKHAEHKQLEQEMVIVRDQCSSKQIEINRLTNLLENARTKVKHNCRTKCKI